MIDHVIKVGLGAGYLAYLLTQSTAAPRWWYRFQSWWPLWGGKPFRCMICMSFWLSLLLLLPSYGIGVYWSVFFPCTAPMCLADTSRYPFEILNSIEGLAIAVLASSSISMLVCYLTDKLSVTILTFPSQNKEQ